MRVRVLWFGRPASSPFEAQVDGYRTRVGRRWAAEDCPLRPAAGGRGTDPRRALAQEAERVRQHLSPDWTLAVLDEAGERLSSVAFAERLAALEERGIAGAAFLVGSDLGVDSSLKRDAALRISLSDMTLPHMIARLVLWEQLFRATSLLGGGGYHRVVVQ